MTVLVTGGTGFVGSHAVKELLARGRSVRLLVRTPAKVATIFTALGLDPGAVDVVAGDITDRASVAAAADGADSVVHAAAVVATDPTRDADVERTNEVGARNVLTAAIEAGCRRIVHVSSSAALFPHHSNPVTPDDPIGRATNTYGRTKAACEEFARSLQADGAPLVIVYPAGVIGPDDPGSTMLDAAKLWVTKPFPLTPGCSGNYIDVRDLALVLAAASDAAVDTPPRVLAFGHHLSFDEQHRLLGAALGRKVKSARLPRALLAAWGRAGTAARRFGRDLVLTSEGVDYLFNTVPGDPSTARQIGVEFRPPVETFRDTYRWMYESGLIDAPTAGTLAERRGA